MLKSTHSRIVERLETEASFWEGIAKNYMIALDNALAVNADLLAEVESLKELNEKIFSVQVPKSDINDEFSPEVTDLQNELATIDGSIKLLRDFSPIRMTDRSRKRSELERLRVQRQDITAQIQSAKALAEVERAI